MNTPVGFRPLKLRNFNVGDRVEWDGQQLGTVTAFLDEDTVAVAWDDPKLGNTMAPTWNTRLRLAYDVEVTEPCCIWDEPTCPGDYV